MGGRTSTEARTLADLAVGAAAVFGSEDEKDLLRIKRVISNFRHRNPLVTFMVREDANGEVVVMRLPDRPSARAPKPEAPPPPAPPAPAPVAGDACGVRLTLNETTIDIPFLSEADAFVAAAALRRSTQATGVSVVSSGFVVADVAIGAGWQVAA